MEAHPWAVCVLILTLGAVVKVNSSLSFMPHPFCGSDDAKPGSCPFTLSSASSSKCKCDRDCPGSLKCCGHRACVTPVLCKIHTTKPGACPRWRWNNEPCPFSILPPCSDDRGCPGTQKCCLNSCGRLCMDPATVKPGTCPPRTGGYFRCLHRGTCYDDGKCPGEEKCCTTWCGYQCKKPFRADPQTCPRRDPGMVGICVEMCSTEEDCPLNKQCCFNGCGHQCMLYTLGSLSKLHFCAPQVIMETHSWAVWALILAFVSLNAVFAAGAEGKSGNCPRILKVVPSQTGCKCDEDCPGDDKCCVFGSGGVCVPPVFTKPGVCPRRLWGNGMCAEFCSDDSDCPNEEKCCSNGCGHQCMPPYTVKPGRCPRPQGTSMCAEYCHHDGECPERQKCCRTTCGHACTEPC
ncbi:WAP four-disulfide core domain protein 3 [Genypterus blacodes]|uniref:WAP four-disulfide core domain protein 3 n=1 Tax=Genypterus blacodes TaxID=154954 RepID=UPI003F7592E1